MFLSGDTAVSRAKCTLPDTESEPALKLSRGTMVVFKTKAD